MITRDNYEEYFLLYTDNELTAAEKAEVERFITHHPDLREEWEAFLQCRVHPEAELVFRGQASLLRPETGESSHTEELLRYLDGELDPAHAARVEAAIRRDTRIANELAALRQAVAQPDMTIGYPDKEALLKQERSRRVVVLPWVRAGVAAAIAGAIVLGLLLPARRRLPVVAVAVNRAQDVHRGGTMSAHSGDRYLPADVTSATASPLDKGGKQSARPPARKEHAARAPQRTTPDAIGTLAAADPGKRVQPEPTGTIDMSQVSGVAAGDPARQPTAAAAGGNDVALNGHPAVRPESPKAESSFATQALQEEANDERAGILVGDEPAAPAKAGLRGLFRKVTRALGKTADRDDDGNRQVLVSAFQVPIN